MVNEELNLELFEEPKKKFIQHLNIENNERIIFSGKFGHGKTTFLKEFFNDENQTENLKKKKYNVISLFPVNYSVASNEDIFRYIKYDIILEMLRQDYKIEDSIESYYQTLPDFFKKNFDKILVAIIRMVPHVGKDIVECYERWEKLKDDFLKFHSDSKLLNNKGDQLTSYIEKLEQSEGTIYEDDLVSKLIEEALGKRLKEDDSDESVLIIDDLDRIDPEHIFRILNLFAAHFDRQNKGSKNKFGFDKIIIVCDIENIRNIFKAKYGSDTDFNGYIDKFYSHEVFAYSIRTAIEQFATDLLFRKANWAVNGKKVDKYEYNFGNRFMYGGFLGDILNVLYDNKKIDLRNLLKWESLPIPYLGNIIFTNRATLRIDQFPVLLYLKMLCLIKGSPESLKESIGSLAGNTLDKKKAHNHIRDLVFILTILEHGAQVSGRANYRIKNFQVEIAIDAKDNAKYEIKEINSQPLYFDNSHLFTLIAETIDFLVAQNIL